MPHTAIVTVPPTDSRIASQLTGASFYDAWSIEASDSGQSALAHFIAAAKRTPRWIEQCMIARNRAGQMVGLKNLGTLSSVDSDKPALAYQAGERIGIFTVIENNMDEALIGDEDKHLNVVLSIHRQPHAHSQLATITITTVVHVKNLLGRIYMLPVKPMHRLIVPSVLARIGHQAQAV